MNYRGIVVEESLQDKSILDSCKILSTDVAEIDSRTIWHIHKVQILEEQIHGFTKAIADKTDPNGTWYSHFYHEDPDKTQMIVTFYKKIFLVSKNNCSKAIEYGLKQGVPAEQLDFQPRDVSKETW
ncbi:MAG TPA: hypothetical protein PKW38_03855 [Paludibacteraceae bacterium]|nr:hypothetical protein [Paludibacteraceae bacterium]HOH74891.1 hypothetical protein [Paludibacteraceae bacterium]